MLPDIYNISGSHGDEQISLLAVCEKIILNLIKGREILAGSSQFLNTLLFTVGAFIGIYDGPTLVSVVLSSYVIFLVTSLLDTPVIYLSRKVKAPKINE